MASISMPYYADAAILPASLPTIDEIESSQDIFCDQSVRKVVGVGPHYIVKYGLDVNLMEGETMIFIRQSTSVSVPRIYALFKESTNNRSYIIMERISGRRLDFEYPLLSKEEKEIIAETLRASVVEMRQLQSPGGYCSVGKRPLLDPIFWTGNTEDTITGPFETEAQLNDAMMAKYIFNNLSPQKLDFYEQALPSILHNHPPVFTHGDLQRKNIIIRKVPGQNQGGEAKYEYDVTIVDWETAGWLPTYWEYCRALNACGRWDDDWYFWVQKILDPFLNEWAWLHMLLLELWS